MAGLMLGRPGHPALIPEQWISSLFLDGNSIWANLIASVAGALMYFATLTEVPILQGLLGAGMGKGPHCHSFWQDQHYLCQICW